MAEKEKYIMRLNPDKVKKSKKHGMNMIAMTNNPAIEVKGFYFNNGSKEKEKVLNDDQKDQVAEYLEKCGVAIDSSWVEITIDEYLKGQPIDVNNFQSNLRMESALDRFSPDGKGAFLIRYKYDGPVDDKNRTFCAKIMGLNKVYTYEEISQELKNPDFGNYSIFDYKGSYGCRHKWVRKYYFVDFDDNETRRVASNPVSRQLAESKDEMATVVNAELSAINYKMRVAAPAIIPGKEIPRKDPESGDIFYVEFTPEQIDEIWSNFQSKNIETKFNINHTKREAPAYLLEGWIIETEEDKAYSKYKFDKEEVPIGSLIVVTQFTDYEFFLDEIIEKKQYGYSVEGFFDIDLKMNKMAEEEKELQKFELNGKTYVSTEDGKLVEFKSDEDEKKDEKQDLNEDEDLKKKEEEEKKKDEARENMNEEEEEENKDQKDYYSKEEVDQKMEKFIEMIAELEAKITAKEEGGDDEEEDESSKFKKEELENKKEEESKNSVTSALDSIHAYMNKEG